MTRWRIPEGGTPPLAPSLADRVLSALRQANAGKVRWNNGLFRLPDAESEPCHGDICPRCGHAGGMDDDDNGRPKCRFCGWREDQASNRQ